MKLAVARLEVGTDEGASITDVTPEVNRFVAEAGIAAGLCILTLERGPCALSLLGGSEGGADDLLRLARRHLRPEARPSRSSPLTPPTTESDRADMEEPGYAPAGVLADCLSIAVRGGALSLGNWDGLYLLDAAGPARHAIEVTLMGP